ncbi:MAG: V-type ATP synthase subunit F [Clostridia bacterium]|nr:V-type ATP synthase subunit F [Clostridia bacterium]
MRKIAAVGSRDTVLAFKALGLEVVPVETAQEASKAVFDLAQNDVPVIFVTEEFVSQIGDTIDRYKTSALPAIIPIPGSTGSTGEGMRRIKANVEKAVGADILFKEEG